MSRSRDNIENAWSELKYLHYHSEIHHDDMQGGWVLHVWWFQHNIEPWGLRIPATVAVNLSSAREYIDTRVKQYVNMKEGKMDQDDDRTEKGEGEVTESRHNPDQAGRRQRALEMALQLAANTPTSPRQLLDNARSFEDYLSGGEPRPTDEQLAESYHKGWVAGQEAAVGNILSMVRQEAEKAKSMGLGILPNATERLQTKIHDLLPKSE